MWISGGIGNACTLKISSAAGSSPIVNFRVFYKRICNLYYGIKPLSAGSADTVIIHIDKTGYVPLKSVFFMTRGGSNGLMSTISSDTGDVTVHESYTVGGWIRGYAMYFVNPAGVFVS